MADKKTQTPEKVPLITTEIATRLVKEAESLRREYRERIEAMWVIDQNSRQTKSR